MRHSTYDCLIFKANKKQKYPEISLIERKYLHSMLKVCIITTPRTGALAEYVSSVGAIELRLGTQTCGNVLCSPFSVPAFFFSISGFEKTVRAQRIVLAD